MGASREDTQRSLSLPAHPGTFLEQLGGDVDDAHQRTRDGLTSEHPIHQLAGGRRRVEQLDALPEPATLTSLREGVDALLPAADLPDLVLEIAAKTGSSTRSRTTRRPAPSSKGSRRACARSSSPRPATSATNRSLTRATRRCAKQGCATSPSATCAPNTRGRERSDGGARRSAARRRLVVRAGRTPCPGYQFGRSIGTTTSIAAPPFGVAERCAGTRYA